MKIFISGKHMEVGDALREHIENALKNLSTRFLDGHILESQVVFSKDRYQFVCDLSVHISRHFIVRTHAEDEDPYRSFNLSLEKMEARMTKYQSRLRNRKRHHSEDLNGFIPAQQYVLNSSTEDEAEQDVPLIIAEMSSTIPTATVSEAVMQMDLSDQPLLMFRNPANGQFNVVYRRGDGNIGWIDPTKVL